MGEETQQGEVVAGGMEGGRRPTEVPPPGERGDGWASQYRLFHF